MKGQTALSVALGVALWGVALPAGAQQASAEPPLEVDGEKVSGLEDIEDASFEGLLGMDLSDRLGATKAVSRTSEEVLRAPAALTTLTEEQLRRAGSTRIAELLRRVPGVQVIRSAPGNYIVSLRGAGGLGGNNVIVTLDGIPLNSPLDGSVDWDAIPVNAHDVERIEVVRGPVSTAYGANAYTGVINIVTREALGVTPAFAARAEVGASSSEPSDAFASGSGRFVHVGPKLRLKWLFDSTSDGLNRGTSDNQQVAHQHAGFIGKIGYQLNEGTVASFEVGRSVSRRSSLDHLVLESEPQRRELLFGQLKLEGAPIGALRSYQLWARSALQLTRTDPRAYTGFSYADTDSNRAAAGADVELRLTKWLDASVSALSTLDFVEAPYIHPDENAEWRTGYGASAGIALHPTSYLDVRLAARGDVSASTARFAESYRGSIIYHGDSLGLRLSGATAFREPSYVEAGGRFVDPASGLILLEGTPSVRPPRNSSLELGATFAPTSALVISPVLYLSRFDDAIVEDFAPVVRRTFRSDPDARSLCGAEISAAYRFSDSLSLHPTFAWLHFLSVNESRVATIGVPEQNSSFTASLQVDGSLLAERLAYGIGGHYASGRSYSVRAGIPPRILATKVSSIGFFDASLEYELLTKHPLWASLRAVASLPGDVVESPLPGAAPLGSSVVLGLEYASE